jgi:transposase
MNRRQTIPAELRYTFQQFEKDFPTDDACLEQIKEQRFPGGVTVCHKCQKPRKHYRVKGRTAYACETCGNHIYPLAGTIFEKSRTALRIWFHAMYLMGSTRCGISAKQIQLETGVTYKTAWRMFKQIRKLRAKSYRFGGEGSGGVEVDEMYHGGRRKNESGRMLGGDAANKTMVMGVVERKGGRIVARIAPRLTIPATNELLREYVLRKTMIFTDDAGAYNELADSRAWDMCIGGSSTRKKSTCAATFMIRLPSFIYSEVDSTRGGEQNSPAEPWAEARRKSLVAHDNWHFHSATRNGAPIPSKQDAIFHFRARGSDSSPNSCAMLNAQDTSASAKPGDRKPPQL